MQNAERNVRIRAAHIRQRLLSRNGSAYFRKLVSELSDAELVRQDEEHHARKVGWVSEQNCVTKHHGRL
jgi:hypothetical protein